MTESCAATTCLECNKNFNSHEDAVAHVESAHFVGKVLACKVCKLKYGDEVTIRAHEENCQLTVPKEPEATYKSERRMLNLFKNIPFPIDENNPDKCPAEDCTYRVPNRSRLRNHYISRHCRQKCPYCDVVLAVTSFELHVVQKHTKKYSFLCEFCPAGFLRKSHMINHMEEEHIKDPKYICDICGKGCFSNNKLAKHKRTRHKTFSCQYCEKFYTRKNSLIKHLKSVHNGIGIEDLFRTADGNYTHNKILRHVGDKAKATYKVLDSSTIAEHILE